MIGVEHMQMEGKGEDVALILHSFVEQIEENELEDAWNDKEDISDTFELELDNDEFRICRNALRIISSVIETTCCFACSID